MKITVHYRDNEPPTRYNHVSKVKLAGLTIALLNINDGIVGIIPIDVVRRIEDVEADTEIVLANKGKVEIING